MSEENEVIKTADEKKKIKFKEKFALGFKKFILADTFRIFLTVATLFICYIAINVWAKDADLPKIDVTKNKIYSVTEASKKALEKIDQDVKIYSYGFEEDDIFYFVLKDYKGSNVLNASNRLI